MRVIQAIRRVNDERGVTAVLVTILLPVFLGFTALAVDTGSMFMTRRNVITATDGAALAAAQQYALGDNGCATATAWLNDSDPDAALVSCTTGGGITPNTGYVTVKASSPAELWFAPVIGLASSELVHSVTTAAYGPPAGVRGLRPMALCDQAPEYLDWRADGERDEVALNFTRRVIYDKDGDVTCGSASGGNWGIIQPGAPPCSNDNIKDVLVPLGIDQPITVGQFVEGDSGAYGNGMRVDQLIGQTFTVPLYSTIVGNGCGAQMRISGFVGMKLIGLQDTGAEKDRYLDVQFTEVSVSGTCCGTGLGSPGVFVTFICGVDDESTNPLANLGCPP